MRADQLEALLVELAKERDGQAWFQAQRDWLESRVESGADPRADQAIAESLLLKLPGEVLIRVCRASGVRAVDIAAAEIRAEIFWWALPLLGDEKPMHDLLDGMELHEPSSASQVARPIFDIQHRRIRTLTD